MIIESQLSCEIVLEIVSRILKNLQLSRYKSGIFHFSEWSIDISIYLTNFKQWKSLKLS